MLTLKDKILLFLDLLSDETLFCPRRLIYSSFGSAPPSSVDRRLRELAKRGVLKFEDKDEEKGIALDQSFVKRLEKEDFGISKTKLNPNRSDWDGLWRLVIFDIPEENKKLRDTFRNKLKSLGFVMFQKSVWVTPFDVTSKVVEFLEETRIKGPVEVLEAKRLLVGDQKEWARKIWRLDSVNDQYHLLLKKKFLTFDNYLDIKVHDPSLPKELLPEPWFEIKVLEILRGGLNS